MISKGKHETTTSLSGWRFLVTYILVGVVIAYYLIRLFTIQVAQGETYVIRAEDNRINTIRMPTQRGMILDRNGVVLARNIASYNVTITPADLPIDEGSVQEVYRRLSALINVPVNNGEINEETVRNFTPCLNDLGITQIVFIGRSLAPYNPVRIRCNIDAVAAKVIRERGSELPGVNIEIEPIREYPTGVLTSTVVGFLGPIPAIEQEYWQSLGFVADRDKVGYAGIENSLNNILIGKNGQRVVEVDVAGEILRDVEPPIEPVRGNNVHLTIDVRLQSAARAALLNNMRFHNIRSGNPDLYTQGVVIVMDVRTGEILAMVSHPTFENNRMARFIPTYYFDQLSRDPAKPLFNHAISAEHSPGSVYKLATAMGALNEGVITPEQELFDPGVIKLEQRFSPNDPRPRLQEYVCYTYKTTGAGHGDVDFVEGVGVSCNVYFYKIGGGYEDEVPGNGLNVWRLKEYAQALGYGRTFGIELPGETDGLVPDPNWKRRSQGENWATGDTYLASVGGGYVLSTPLQVLVSAATIAADGRMMKPTLIREITNSEGEVVRPFEPQLILDITKDAVINIYDENFFQTGETKTVEPWVIEEVQKGMLYTVVEGTVARIFGEEVGFESAGKTGTAEYCDNVAREKGICQPGSWPSHAWYMGYAPYNNPEIAVVTFVYNGGEGAILAGPVVRQVMEAYFALKEIDMEEGGTNVP
ncbi:MAG: penicillin-binding protein 2 [Bellilinea sp.]|jgi:penicillin-binding protein 2